MRSDPAEGGREGDRPFRSPWRRARAHHGGAHSAAAEREPWSGGAIVLGVLTGFVAFGHLVGDASMIVLLMSEEILEEFGTLDTGGVEVSSVMQRYAWIQLGLSGFWFLLMAWVYALARSIVAQVIILILGVAMPFIGTLAHLYPALIEANVL